MISINVDMHPRAVQVQVLLTGACVWGDVLRVRVTHLSTVANLNELAIIVCINSHRSLGDSLE